MYRKRNVKSRRLQWGHRIVNISLGAFCVQDTAHNSPFSSTHNTMPCYQLKAMAHFLSTETLAYLCFVPSKSHPALKSQFKHFYVDFLFVRTFLLFCTSPASYHVEFTLFHHWGLVTFLWLSREFLGERIFIANASRKRTKATHNTCRPKLYNKTGKEDTLLPVPFIKLTGHRTSKYTELCVILNS